jgi:hypothetical protein
VSETNHQKPVFDYSGHSWKDSKRLQVLQARANQADALLNDPETLVDPDAFDEALAMLDQVTDEFEAAIARVLVDVPRDWLVPDAPETLDWHDPESLNWLQATHMKTLREAMVEAQKPEEVSGNSARRSSSTKHSRSK